MTFRIVQFVNTLATSDGGPARNSFELNLALNAMPSVQSDLLAVRGSWFESAPKSFADGGGELPSPGPRWIGGRRHSRRLGYRNTARVLRQSDVVVIHGYFLWWVPAVALLATLAHKPVVLMPHGALTAHELATKSRKKLVFQAVAGAYVCSNTHAFAVGSGVEARDLRSVVPGATVEVVGVGTAPPATVPNARELARPVRLVTLSRIAPKKRIDLAIAAVAELQNRGIPVHLDIAGSGDSTVEASLRQMVVDLSLQDSVEFVGMVDGDHKVRLLLGSDIFLLPSEDENFGIAVAEASAHGLPVVASSNVAAAAQLRPPAVGLVRALDAESLADAVAAIIKGFKPQDRLEAHQQATREFDWRTVADRWLTLLRRSVGENDKTGF